MELLLHSSLTSSAFFMYVFLKSSLIRITQENMESVAACQQAGVMGT